jgi:hypothetical protein
VHGRAEAGRREAGWSRLITGADWNSMDKHGREAGSGNLEAVGTLGSGLKGPGLEGPGLEGPGLEGPGFEQIGANWSSTGNI